MHAHAHIRARHAGVRELSSIWRLVRCPKHSRSISPGTTERILDIAYRNKLISFSSTNYDRAPSRIEGNSVATVPQCSRNYLERLMTRETKGKRFLGHFGLFQIAIPEGYALAFDRTTFFKSRPPLDVVAYPRSVLYCLLAYKRRCGRSR